MQDRIREFLEDQGTNITGWGAADTELLRGEILLQYESNELYRLLHAGAGPDAIVIRAEEFLGRAVALLDASYSMLAVSPMIRELPFGFESSEEGNFLSAAEVESLRRLQIEGEIYRHTQAFCIHSEDHPDTNWIFCAIRIRHVMSGYVAVCLPGFAEATEHELRLTTILADVCSVEMQKQDYVFARSDLGYDSLFGDLIDGRFHNSAMVESRFRMLNHPLGKYFCLAVLCFPEPHNSELFHKQQMASLRSAYPSSLSTVYRNNIVLLLNQDHPVLLTPELTGPLERFAARNQLKVSLSQPFADILKTRIFYEQAVHTLDLIDQSAPDGHLFYSTQAFPDYLFSKCSYEELEVGIHYHIFHLQDYDREYHTEFIPTLRAFLKNNRNTTKTAEDLHIHRTTLFYRMKKIEELLDVDLTDGHLLFLYELSLKIWDYLSR